MPSLTIRTRRAALGTLLPLALAVTASAQQPAPAKHHSKAKGAVAGGAAGAVVGGPVGAAAGAAVGAEVQHHKNVRARHRASRARSHS